MTTIVVPEVLSTLAPLADRCDAAVVCPSDELPADAAVVATALDGAEVAVIRTASGALHAVGNLDPYTGELTVAGGSLGLVAVVGLPREVVESLDEEHVFDLRTGRCASDPDVTLGVWDVAEADGVIAVRNNRITPRGLA